VSREKIDNIRFYNNDSRYLLEIFPHDSIDKIYILFPDPWPKKKQFKRRIVNRQLLDMLHPLLKDKGVIRLATDIDSYFEQMLKVFAADKRFRLLTKEKDYAKVPADHIETRYQQKAVRESRLPRFIEYSKI
jgi:tRNA (guanine-N7-)-methyltransferase